MGAGVSRLGRGRRARVHGADGPEWDDVSLVPKVESDKHHHRSRTMENNRIQFGFPASHEPTPEEIRRLMRVGECLQNQAFRNIPRDVITLLTRAFRRREVESAHANSVTQHAHAA